MNAPSYLIVGTNFINKGAEAMLKTVSLKIREKHPNSNIYVICHPQEKEIAQNQGFIPLYVASSTLEIYSEKVINKLKTLSGQEPKPYADKTPIEKVKAIPNLVAAVDASGFAYGDKRGYQQPIETQMIIDHCKKVGARYIFMPQAWGGFKENKVAANCKKMIQSADVYFTRDEVSRSYVADLLNEKIADIPLVPDIAFHFPIPNISGLELLQKNQFDNPDNKPLLGISPNMRVYERMPGKGTDNTYVQSFLNIIESLKEKYHIVLIPNEIRPPNDTLPDDAFLCGVLYSALSSTKDITLIKGYYSAEEIKSIIRECELLIASRFHSLIFALSLGIPCLAISWSHKYRELFRLFDMEKFVIEDKDIQLENLFTLFHELETKKDDFGLKITAEVEEIKKLNHHVFDLI